MLGQIRELQPSVPSTRLMTSESYKQQAKIRQLELELRESRLRHRMALHAADELDTEVKELSQELTNSSAQCGILLVNLRDILLMLQGHAGIINEADHPADFSKLSTAWELAFGGDCAPTIGGPVYAELAI